MTENENTYYGLGSEIHRIPEFEGIDQTRFNKYYKLCKPVIRNLTFGIDNRRFRVTPDIIQSYFWDKFLFVYNKYQSTYSDEKLKATLLSSLKTFKNKLLRRSYQEKALFNQELSSFENLFESGKEWLDDSEEQKEKEEKLDTIKEFMMNHLTSDEYLLFTIQLNPPVWFANKPKRKYLAIDDIIEYFELPNDTTSRDMINRMKKHINKAIKLAATQFA